MMQTANAMNRTDAFSEQDKVVAQAAISAVAVGLFAAQAQGLIKFPAGPFTIGEIESSLDTVVGATIEKFVEVAEQFEQRGR